METQAQKFTPGPWAIITGTAREGAEKDGATVIGTDALNICVMSDGDSPESCLPDARLIASAPDLLRALTDLCKEIPLHKLNVRKDFSLMNAHAQACKLLHTIIEAQNVA